MWYIHTMSYYLATKRSKQSHLWRCGWIQSLSYRVRHIRKRKNKYHILMHMYSIQKNAYDVPICRPGIEMQTQRRDTWTQWWERRWDELGAQRWYIYTTLWKIDSQCKSAVQHRQLCDNLGRWNDREGGSKARGCRYADN